MDAPGVQRLADIQVDLVQPEHNGFTLSGQGDDRAHYQLALHFDMPLDARTRTVLGELLAQSEVSIWRGSPAGLGSAPRPPRRPRRRIPAD